MVAPIVDGSAVHMGKKELVDHVAHKVRLFELAAGRRADVGQEFFAQQPVGVLDAVSLGGAGYRARRACSDKNNVATKLLTKI